MTQQQKMEQRYVEQELSQLMAFTLKLEDELNAMTTVQRE